MKLLLALASLALVAVLAVVPVRAQTVTSAGAAVNATLTMPLPSPTYTCASVRPSTHTPTLLLAAPASGIRAGLYIQNVSSNSMVSSRPPDVVLTPSSALAVGTAGVGPAIAAFRTLPGVFLSPMGHGQIDAVVPTSIQPMESRFEQRGSGIFNGAVYAIAESSGATVDVRAQVTACEWY